MARIENHKFTIDEAFRECFYIVPDYQREYVWSEKVVSLLLEDINEQIDGSSSEYFIGTVLVSPTKEKSHFEVIDGQQRLTTFFLILCALRSLFKGQPQGEMISSLTSISFTDAEGDIRTNLKLDPRYENAGEVIEKLVQINCAPQTLRATIQAAGIPIYGSVENILTAYNTIYRYLTDNYDDAEKLKKYWGHLANNVVFIQISTDVSSALKIFETINERGVGLNPMDLLKNLLFIQVPPESFSKLKDEWKKITSPLEKNKEKPLRFLRYFLMANYAIENKRNDSIVREDEIYDWFSDKKNAEITGYQDKPIDFVRKIIRNVDLYISFGNGHGNDGKPSLAMDSLRQLTGGAFSLHYVLLLAAANFPQSLFEHFVAQLESFLFSYIFTKTPTKDLERNFSHWADEIREIVSLGDHDKQRAALNQFVADRFEKNIANKSGELKDALKRLTLHSMQQYRMRYLLSRLTQHVDMAFSGQKQRGSLEPYTKLEIEHILPNNPKGDLRASWSSEHPDLVYDDHKVKLGNLTLLEKPINIVAGNDFYSLKRPEYAKSGNYLARSLDALADVGQNTSITRINEKLCAFDTWSSDDIEKRQMMLINLAHEIWRTTAIDEK